MSLLSTLTHMDGPDYYALFNKGQLIPEYHTKEIISYLRFFKDQSDYQRFLGIYLPKLNADERAEFLPDVKDPELAASLTPEKKKVGRPAKKDVESDTSTPTSDVPAN